MAHLYLGRELLFENVCHYAFARVGRIFPLYLSLVVFSFVISNYFFEEFYYNYQELKVFLLALFFVKSPYAPWSVPVEVQFYVIFMVFWWLYQRVSKWAIWFFGFLVCMPTILYSVTHYKVIGTNSKYLFSFFIGVATSLAFSKIRKTKKLKEIADYAGMPLLILMLMNLPWYRKYFGLYVIPDLYFRTWLDPVTWGLIYGVFWCALLESKTLGFLRWKPFVLFGGISYGFYLLHSPILEHAMPLAGSPFVKLVLIFLGTTLCSYLSFQYFEKPIGLRIRTWGGSKIPQCSQ